MAGQRRSGFQPCRAGERQPVRLSGWPHEESPRAVAIEETCPVGAGKPCILSLNARPARLSGSGILP
jgi:hypothetical protein